MLNNENGTETQALLTIQKFHKVQLGSLRNWRLAGLYSLRMQDSYELVTALSMIEVSLAR